MDSRVCVMLARMRRKVVEASSLISPFGRTQRRIAASTSRKSATAELFAASNGNFAASRNCPRSHPAVSSSEPASRNSFASSTAPGPSSFTSHSSGSASAPKPNSAPPRSHSRASRISANAASSAARFSLNSSASTPRRPGAHVVRSRSNSRSLSNSSTSCAVRAIKLPPRLPLHAPLQNVHPPDCCALLLDPSNSLFQLFAQVFSRLRGGRSHVHEPPVGFSPWRFMREFDFAHTIQNRLPEVSQHNKRFRRHHRFIKHLPHNRQRHHRTRASLARHQSVGAPNQFEQPRFPRLHANFVVNPRIKFGFREKVRRYSVRRSSGFFRTARNPGHHSAISSAANRKAALRECSSELPRLLVVRVARLRPRASEHRNDFLFFHSPANSFCVYRVFRPRLPLAARGRIPQASRRIAHSACPWSRDFFRSDCCSEMKKSAASRSACLQIR